MRASPPTDRVYPSYYHAARALRPSHSSSTGEKRHHNVNTDGWHSKAFLPSSICETTGSSLWNNLKCSHCTEQCIRRQNLVYEDGPQDRGLIHSVRVCCSRLTTMTQVSTRIFFDLEDDAEVDEAVGLLEYRTLSDDDDLHEPIWTFSQIIQGRSFTLSGLECHKLYQFRLTLVTRKIIDRRTSSWISNRHLCRY
ncbi:hypothetical protein Q1695_008895 [Nippostrongylus brasiliensis]|nr:hypothetical protein Q1695_008895 [Nippostrongylus brasiliensis]